jgi:4-oxalmesaconate hydratase
MKEDGTGPRGLSVSRISDPRTGFAYDDPKRYIDAIDWFTPEDRQKIFSGNAKKVFTRLAARCRNR